MMKLASGEFSFMDVKGLERTSSEQLELEGMILDGRWWS